MSDLAGSGDALIEGFETPPKAARPRVWWHWMNGNVTEAGIRRDLEWMARVGLGGLQSFDAHLATPQVVETRLSYMTPAWRRAFRLAATLADQLGLELAIASSPGWSETGGPWVAAEDGIKKYVWSEAVIEGAVRFTGRLPQPPTRTGPFQDAPAARNRIVSETGRETPSFYADTVVVAFPLSEAADPVGRALSSSDGEVDAATLDDGQLTTLVELEPPTAGAPAWLRVDFPSSRPVSSASLATIVPADVSLPATLEASDDGEAFRAVAAMPTGGIPQHTISFPPVTARAFRVRFDPFVESEGLSRLGGLPGVAPANFGRSRNRRVRIARFDLHAAARVHRFEEKAGFGLAPDYDALETPAGVDARPIAPGDVVDVTAHMSPDGRLDWTPPAPGAWKVLRFGYSLTGKENHPATAEATGLEVDKLDRAAVNAYIETYLDTFMETVGPDLMGAHGVRALLNDSIEVGPMNWTGALIDEFRTRRGYDPTPWLPTLAGLIVGGPAQSDAFLYDYRRTIGELLADHHYGEIARVAHARGLVHYAEALEDGRPSLGDDMAMRRHADVPMGAMWTYTPERGPRPTYVGDLLGAASVAHVYGQNLVGAESMTACNSPWAFAPADLKPNVDLQLALGVNRLMIHTSVHQPTERKPGLSLAVFGQYFNRHETWAEQAGPWVDYIARSCFLLQQGRFVADVAWVYGEDAPLTALFAEGAVDAAPRGHGFDFVGADAVLNELDVEDGTLGARHGARYGALYLGRSAARMTLPVLRKLAALVRAGAVLIGERPTGSPSLADDAADFAALADALWKADEVGKGRIVATGDLAAGLRQIALATDFDWTPDAPLRFVHRRLADGDLYFVSHSGDAAVRIEASFRVAGRRPELWRADGGVRGPLSWRCEGGRTLASLDLAAHDAVFVVFREPTSLTSEPAPAVERRPLRVFEGPWRVTFEPDRGAPAQIVLDRLASLSEHGEPGVRYFSGAATYRTGFDLDAGASAGTGLWLDLGEVGDVAEVWVNGERAGVSVLAPHRLAIGALARPGRNQLEVRAVNVWANRLIGDAQPGAEKVAFTTLDTYLPDAPLRRSGLIGPVRLELETSR